MPTIQMEAFDTLFFRDGKPFSMGDDVWANGVFPPYPSSLYGALRASYFSNNIKELENANSETDISRNLKINKIYYHYGMDDLVPIPLDLVSIKDNKVSEGKAFQMSLEQKENLLSNSPFIEKLTYTTEEKLESVDGNFLRIDQLEKYLNSKSKDYSYYQAKDLFTQESKIGIARNQISKIADEGRIYRIAMMRSKEKNFSIVIEYENLELSQKGNFKLGADGKIVNYKSISNMKVEPAQNLTNRFKLYLLTPAIFKSGWLPFGLSSNQLETDYFGIKLKLLTCVVGKYINIGGFQIKNGKQSPKPMYRAVPAGSVYYFESDCNDPQKILDLFHNQSISDENKKEGFGITLVGKI